MDIKNKWGEIPKVWRERIKEVLRWFVFGIASLYVLNQGDFDLVWAIKTVTLRIVDRLVHLYGKEEDISWLVKGLTRF